MEGPILLYVTPRGVLFCLTSKNNCACFPGFWMSDKPLVQQDLSQELANLILLIPSLQPAIGFLHGFWEAMVREWAGIDRFR